MIDQLKKEYLEWTQQRIRLEESNEFVEIITPFVDMHHDYISLFFINESEKYKLTDDGYVIDELESLGVDVGTSQKRNQFFKSTLNVFGINFDKATSELYVEFNNLSEYPEAQQRLIQCVMRVSDMMLTSRNRIISFFTEDIANFFLDKDVFFNESPSFIGRSGRNQTFEFALPKSKKVKPKLIKAVNNPTPDAFRDPLLAFIDVQQTKSDHGFIVLANDVNAELSSQFVEPLKNYNINVLPWSDRENWVNDLKSH
ncbi:DUF1828 domain-containing protein [Lentibacillus sp.]|uniref:DUF1828 domain-containing protein n=1 Tax=Lentibacillus sp. TaxID=1925746 RepID=UPI002B4B436B|nr:DUF1828 domain-containing protein [Lentibacillus sp.]HLS08003.1 DUF1828 domain-containing protein [Lentibacillus sp.]